MKTLLPAPSVHGCDCPPARSRRVIVLVEGRPDDRSPWELFVGAGGNVNSAVWDGQEHVYEWFGDDAETGDWKAG